MVLSPRRPSSRGSATARAERTSRVLRPRKRAPPRSGQGDALGASRRRPNPFGAPGRVFEQPEHEPYESSLRAGFAGSAWCGVFRGLAHSHPSICTLDSSALRAFGRASASSLHAPTALRTVGAEFSGHMACTRERTQPTWPRALRCRAQGGSGACARSSPTAAWRDDSRTVPHQDRCSGSVA